MGGFTKMRKDKRTRISNEMKTEGFRARADEYKQIIDLYIQRLTLIKESNVKFNGLL